MGTLCSPSFQPLPVLSLPPYDPQLQLHQKHSLHFSDVIFTTQGPTQHTFSLQLSARQVQVCLPVLSQLIHTLHHPNYSLTLQQSVLLDPNNRSLNFTLFSAKNESLGTRHSLRICPFPSYNSAQFKRIVQELWLLRWLPPSVRLQDSFICALDACNMATVLLFESVDCSLAQIIVYRREACWPWTIPAKLAIIKALLQYVCLLHKRRVYHRSIRPAALFLRKDKYYLGALQTAKEITVEEDILTVCGVRKYAESKLKILIGEDAEVGMYSAEYADYAGIQSVISCMESLNLAPSKPWFSTYVLESVYWKLGKKQPLEGILQYLKMKIISDGLEGGIEEDEGIGREVRGLRRRGQEGEMEGALCDAYAALGYYKEYSERAERRIRDNIKEGNILNNADILQRIGRFYKRSGVGGFEYFLNASILYCRRAEGKLRGKMYVEAERELAQAQDTYLLAQNNEESMLLLLEIRRVSAELGKGLSAIQALVVEAARVKLPIQRQMRVFLSYSRILMANERLGEAEEQLRNALIICEKETLFKNRENCQHFKAQFMHTLGELLLRRLQSQYDPRVKPSQQKYSQSFECQTLLNEAVSVYKRQNNGLQLVLALHLLSKYYILRTKYSQATSTLHRALSVAVVVHPRVTAEMRYDLAAAAYKLRDYEEAEREYKWVLDCIDEHQLGSLWKASAVGSYGLTLRRRGREKEGKEMVEQGKAMLSAAGRKEHYDYSFLCRESRIIDNL